ncbi:hypothetical protein ACFLW4_00890 [Chloroflexota bacterium]
MAERANQLRAFATYLRGLGVDANLVEKTREGTVIESAICLKGQSIGKLYLEDYDEYGTGSSASRFHFQIALDKVFPRSSGRTIAAKVKTIKENKFLGLFGGKVVGIKWVGGDLAVRLNRDMDLSRTLLECAKYSGSVELQIQAKSPATVEILGPKFVGPLTLLKEREADLKICDELFEFQIYERIAKQVRNLLGTS